MLRRPNPTKSLLAALLFSSAAFATTNRAECMRNRAGELADLAACGDRGSLSHCFAQLPEDSHLCDSATLEKCFVAAGCTSAEAQIEASWSIKRCDENADAENLGELRRRQGNRPPANGDDDETTTARQTNRQQSATRNTAAATTVKATPTPAKPTDTPTPSPSPPPTTPPAPSTEALSATPTQLLATTTASSKKPCYTTSTVETSFCPTQSTGVDAGKKLECFPTSYTFQACNAGMLCRSDTQGQAVCLEIDNRFTTAGIVISLVFAVIVTLSIASICFFCCRERRQENRLLKAAEAAAIAKAAALDKKRPSVAVRNVSAQSDQAPLMGPQGGGVMYANDGGADPFADPRMR